MELRSFFGILPPRLPYPDISVPVESLPMPEKIALLFPETESGDVAVRVGEDVRTGQDMAREGKGPFVSTVSGRVEGIETFTGPHGRDRVVVAISADSRDAFDPSLKKIEDFSQKDPWELREAVNRSGFTDLSAISRNPTLWPPVEVLVVSALDRDILSLANQQTFRDRADDLHQGIQLLVRASEARHSVLAVPKHLEAMAAKISPGPAKAVPVSPFYPNGLPAMLARNCGAGLLMKGDYRGLSGNTLVVSVEHAMAMAECLQGGKPFLEKRVTFSSGQAGGFKNLLVRIGTPLDHILQAVGAALEPQGKLIVNGILCGYACFSDRLPVTPQTDAVHVQGSREVFFYDNAPCINCGKCNAICPVGLEVNLLGRLSEYGMTERCRDLGVENCIDCGLCAYLCPAHRPLVQLLARAKEALRSQAQEEIRRPEAPAGKGDTSPPPPVRLFESTPEEEEALRR